MSLTKGLSQAHSLLTARLVGAQIHLSPEGSRVFSMEDTGSLGTAENSMAKVAVSEALMRVADRCVQVMGGTGVPTETIVEQAFREIRAFRIYDGPTEVHKWSLAKKIKRERNAMRVSGLVYLREAPMPQSKRGASTDETGGRVSAHPHDTGSQANETVDGLDASTESLRHAAEDTPSGSGPSDIEKTPVFDRAGAAPHI
jgi:hypothetical protein